MSYMRADRKAPWLLLALSLVWFVTTGAMAAVPPRQPNNPDYLTRIAFLIPTDRLLDYVASPDCPGVDCPLYTAKVDDTSARIRTVMESLSDFFSWEMQNHAVAIPGRDLNIERDGLGQVHVNVIHGTMPTQGAAGLWGDATGLNGYSVYYNSLGEVLGNTAAVTTETEKTSWIIFTDSFVFDTSTIPATFRGYIGLGTSQNESTSGWGGTCVVASGILKFFPPDPGTAPARQALLQDYLCSNTLTITIDGQTGNWRERRPYNGVVTNLMLGELCSTYLGVIGHEFLHTLNAGHGGLSGYSDLMGSGYNRIGQSLRTMYSFASCPSVPLAQAPNFLETRLGEPFSNLAARSPYFDPVTHPDKTDPGFNWAFPPRGYFFSVPAGQSAQPYLFRLAGGDNSGGAGLSAAYLYSDDGFLYDFEYFPPSGRINPIQYDDPWYDVFIGRRNFGLVINDVAGNMRYSQYPAFGMIFESPHTDAIYRKTVFVRPPADPRNGAMALGSYSNAYSNIQTAVNAADALGAGTVIIMNGTYPLTTSIALPNGVNLVGESVGGVLLDGQGGSFDIISDPFTGHRNGNVITNLSFANALAAYTRPASWAVYNFMVSNCLFYNLTNNALTIPYGVDVNVEVVQNTVVNCGGGFEFNGSFYLPGEISKGFLFQNNIVSGCAGTGIRMDYVVSLYSGQSGYNLSYGNGINFNGNGDGIIAGGYVTNRLPGEISVAPQFEDPAPYISPLELKLVPGSRGTHEADPWTENFDGQRRDMGAFIGIADLVNNSQFWTRFE